jgi:hypothetical protein
MLTCLQRNKYTRQHSRQHSRLDTCHPSVVAVVVGSMVVGMLLVGDRKDSDHIDPGLRILVVAEEDNLCV